MIGTLLGTVSPDGVVEVKNSYAVPHNEQDDTVFVDVEFHRAMIDLHQKVNPGEKIVGWYSTGDGIVPTDALIHEFYAHECVDPVHVTLDVNFVDRSKLMRAWTGQSLVVGAASAADAKAAAAAAVAAPATPEKDENTGSRSASEATERPAAAPPRRRTSRDCPRQRVRRRRTRGDVSARQPRHRFHRERGGGAREDRS